MFIKVKAKWNVAYKDVRRKGGEVFEMSEGDFETYKNDVEVVKGKKKAVKKASNKQVKKAKNK